MITSSHGITHFGFTRATNSCANSALSPMNTNRVAVFLVCHNCENFRCDDISLEDLYGSERPWEIFQRTAILFPEDAERKKLQGDLHERQNQESEIQKELDKLKDILSFEKRNLVGVAYDCDKFRSLCDETNAELQAALARKNNLEMLLLKSSSQGSKKDISNQLVEAQNQVLKKMKEDMKARNMLHAAEGTKMRLLSEKASLEQKIIVLEKKKLSEVENA